MPSKWVRLYRPVSLRSLSAVAAARSLAENRAGSFHRQFEVNIVRCTMHSFGAPCWLNPKRMWRTYFMLACRPCSGIFTVYVYTSSVGADCFDASDDLITRCDIRDCRLKAKEVRAVVSDLKATLADRHCHLRRESRRSECAGEFICRPTLIPAG